MLMSDFDSRRGFDDRWDGSEWSGRQGRQYGPRYEGRRYTNGNIGDWMREGSGWLRDSSWQGPWQQGPWQQGPWQAGQQGWQQQGPWMQGGPWQQQGPWMHGPWMQGPWMQQGGPWQQGGSLQQGPWQQGPWMQGGSREPWVNGVEPMTRVIEVFAESPHSWEDATRRAIAEASQTVRGIRSIYIQDMQAVVEEDRVVGYRINAKISFSLDDNRRRR
jgi:flavin-binding protein dodecin